MAETTLKTNGQDNQPQFQGIFSAALLDSAESLLEVQAGLLADIEETVVTSLQKQQETVQKVLELMDEMRNANSLADHMKMQIAASEQCLSYGINLWTDTTSMLSQRALKRLESGNRVAMTAAGLGRKAGMSAGSAMKAATEKTASAVKSAASRSAEAA